ncbi:response regulator transcription factor [Deinococcus peraridilitoris]|uniref:response regulator transcription factor n=1 Tax=Deinococcus peraridilitoris TaxID=432329 RepID=UPI0002EDA666|nr:response regulator transcription factor [Deinococcus peraridilitoris]
MSTVLVVDDDPGILEVLRLYLEAEQHHVLEARDGLSALDLLAQADVAIFDWMLPHLSGIELTVRARELYPELPVMLLTARGEEEDRLHGLNTGADDYVSKPFSPREVVARVHALLRRAGVREVLQAGPLSLSLQTRVATLNGTPLDLSKLEFDLLVTLAQHPGLVWTRERLVERVWGVDYPGTARVVDVQITNLRKRLADDPDHPRFIETVRGVGYKFKADVPG